MKNKFANNTIIKKIQSLFSNPLTNKVLLSVIGLLILYAAVISTLNFMNTPKVGYIDSSVLMEKYPPAIKAREDFEQKSTAWKENTKTLENEINQLNQELVEKSSQWAKDQITKRQEEIKKKQIEYQRYGNAITKKAQDLEKELFEPVYTELNNKINDFGKDEGYQIIFGTLSGGNILYGNNSTDLTQDFLAYASTKN